MKLWIGEFSAEPITVLTWAAVGVYKVSQAFTAARMTFVGTGCRLQTCRRRDSQQFNSAFWAWHMFLFLLFMIPLCFLFLLFMITVRRSRITYVKLFLKLCTTCWEHVRIPFGKKQYCGKLRKWPWLISKWRLRSTDILIQLKKENWYFNSVGKRKLIF